MTKTFIFPIKKKNYKLEFLKSWGNQNLEYRLRRRYSILFHFLAILVNFISQKMNKISKKR